MPKQISSVILFREWTVEDAADCGYNCEPGTNYQLHTTISAYGRFFTDKALAQDMADYLNERDRELAELRDFHERASSLLEEAFAQLRDSVSPDGGALYLKLHKLLGKPKGTGL